jgi:GH15 family glucan-1,4-alpha-glucosidase
LNNPGGYTSRALLEREEEARKVIDGCRRENGFYASTQHYHALWLRDLVYSEDVLLKLGYQRDVKNHLSEFIKLQRRNGQMPTMIDLSFSRLIRQRYQSCPSDTEILFVMGMCKYAEFAGNQFFRENEEAVKSCVTFIENKMDQHQFIPDMDWRDAMPNYKGKCLLANQMLLADMYELLGKAATANLVKENVNKFFYSKDLCCYADTVHWEGGELKKDHNFDSLGNALAILNGTASEEVSEGILKGFNAAKTPFGYRNIAPHYDFNRAKLLVTWYFTCGVANGAFLRNKPGRYQNSAIWPFVEIRVVDALRKLRATNEAEAVTNLMIERKGFNEFYDPATGAPGGSEGQLWTAAAVVSAVDHCKF